MLTKGPMQLGFEENFGVVGVVGCLKLSLLRRHYKSNHIDNSVDTVFEIWLNVKLTCKFSRVLSF